MFSLINKKVLYKSIKSQFYRNPSTASILFEYGKRISYASTNERVISSEIAVISIPQIYYGEGIKAGTVNLLDEQTSTEYIDDGYSNLRTTTNDIAGNTGPMTLEMIQNNYTSIAELARLNGIRVIFASILPVHDYGKRKMSDRRSPEQILKLNEWLKSYCKTNGHTYLDYFSRMVDEKGWLKADLANDGLHPNADGYRIMAPLAEAAIRQALGMKNNPRKK